MRVGKGFAMLGWQEVFITFFLNDFVTARETLDTNNIPYRYRFKDMSAACGNRAGTIEMDYSTQYRVFVKKHDAQQVRYLINKALHG